MSYLNGLVVLPTFFNLSLNLSIRSSWTEPQSAHSLFLLTLWSFSIFGCKEYSQSDFDIVHLVISMFRVFFCVVERWCLLWPGFVCALKESVSPVLWSHSGGPMVLLMATSSKKAYAIPRSAAPRAPVAGHCWLIPPQETLRHSLTPSLCVGHAFVPFPGLSNSGDQVLGECTIPGGPRVLITSQVLAAQSSGCASRVPSHVYCVSPLESWSQPVNLLGDVNHPGSQEDVVSN